MDFNDMDDLFNDFMGKGFENKSRKEMEDALKNIFQNKINNIDNPKSDYDKIKALGKPDEVEEFEESGLKFIKKTWHTDNGDFVLVETSGDLSGSDVEAFRKEFEKENIFTKGVTLEERLEDALEEEDYEMAAELRDRIKVEKDNEELFE